MIGPSDHRASCSSNDCLIPASVINMILQSLNGPITRWPDHSMTCYSEESYIRSYMKALILSLIVLLPASAAARDEVLVGYAEVDITPELGGSIPGYFRERLSTGVLDPLL